MEYKSKPLAPKTVNEWPAWAQAIQQTYGRWTQNMHAAGTSEHHHVFRSTLEDGQLTLRTPVGDVIPLLTFRATDDGSLRGRVLFYRPAIAAIRRQARPVFSLTVTDDGNVYTGDSTSGGWASAGSNYSWGTIKGFIEQLMVAIVDDERVLQEA